MRYGLLNGYLCVGKEDCANVVLWHLLHRFIYIDMGVGAEAFEASSRYIKGNRLLSLDPAVPDWDLVPVHTSPHTTTPSLGSTRR